MSKRGFFPALILLGGLGWMLPEREAGACTTFCLSRGEEVVYGKNYDWQNGNGYLMVNQRGVAKAALVGPPDRPATWTSKYGSVTFNQWGREFPSGGMNEAGLVVELMWLDGTRYPERDARPALGALEWIQYQLDNFARVSDVVKQAAGTRIVSPAPLHFLVCEKTGRCATVEFLGGKLVAHHGSKLPVPALANHSYQDSLEFLKSRRGEEGARGEEGRITGGRGSLERFARASAMMEDYASRTDTTPVQYAFEILDRVAQGSFTQWSIVYDQRRGRVHFKTRANRSERSVDLRALDFTCGGPLRMIDLEAPGAGDVTRRLGAYTPEKNRDLVVLSYETTPEFRRTPREVVDAIASHPERTTCARKP